MMMSRRLAVFVTMTVLGAIASITATPASAATVWNLEMHHEQTNFSPGGMGELWFDVNNVGDTDSGGQVTVKIQLPFGLTRDSIMHHFPGREWECPGLPGETTVTCTTSETTLQHHVDDGLILVVDVSPEAAGDLVATAQVEGGGAVEPASDSEVIQVNPAPASFGIVPGTFRTDFFESNGLTPVRQAGAHPELATFAFDFNSVEGPNFGSFTKMVPAGTIRDLEVELPPGFVGNPTAVGECTPAQLTQTRCPVSSQVGRIDAALSQEDNFHTDWLGVYNMTHPRGVVTDLAFELAGNPVHIKASLDPANHYAIRTVVPNINETLPPLFQKLTLWGTPADPSHDAERCELWLNSASHFNPQLPPGGCPTDFPRRPFLTVPSQCEVDHSMKLRNYDSWQDPGAYGPAIDYQLPGRFTNCDRPRFEPAVKVHPTGLQANTPTGLEVHLNVPQNENPNALATPPVKSVEVSLPEGMTLSPSFANGLAGCSEAQFGISSSGVPNGEPVACPDNSRIGTVSLSTPVLPKAVEGSLYLANQSENPFGTTFAVYLAVHDTEERGVLIKIPGRIDLNPASGQITTTFDELPQFPFEEFTLSFRSGERAPLINPPSCGTQTIAARIASYAQPGNLIDVSGTYQVSEGPNGTPCPTDPAHRPFAPKLDAGSLNPVAGVYSPFLFRLSREDSEQEVSQVTTMLPPGVTAKIAGIPYCPDGAIAAISEAEGTGRAQAAHPSCPAASQVGTVETGVGAGTEPNYFEGKVYLAGPYHGAPLSLVVVVPALAGPYDLGSVVVRAAIYVDPTTAQVRVVSDPLPTILHGVLLRIRDIRLSVDRSDTTLNPTSCNRMSVGATLTSVYGAVADASNPFQVGDCARLGFKPRLSFRLKGGTHRGDNPALRTTLRARPGDANIARAVVALPHSEFLEQSHIRTICTRVQFAADACPAASIYGHARAITPLLDQPLEGPVYLRSSSHRLPDLVAKLNGTFEVDLDGRIDSFHRGIRTTFAVVPDAPVTKFTLNLPGGKKSLLVNSRNLCKSPERVDVKMVGQNGKTEHTHPKLRTTCRGNGHHKHHRRHRNRF